MGARMDGGRGRGASLDQAHLVVVGRELMEQLLDAVLLSRAVHVGHLVLRQGAVVLMNLRETKTQTSGRFCSVSRGSVVLSVGLKVPYHAKPTLPLVNDTDNNKKKCVYPVSELPGNEKTPSFLRLLQFLQSVW